MKILAIIPARGGSKGVPRKNIKLLGDKPLIQYTIEEALKSVYIDYLMVNTDDFEIAKISKKLGAKVPFLRPKDLSDDNSPMIDSILFTLAYFKKKDKYFDIICLLQPTTPFRKVEDIDSSIRKFIDSNYDSLISVLPVPHQFNPNWVFFTNSNNTLMLSTGGCEPINRRQDLPKAYYRSGDIYLAKTDTLLNQKSFYTKNLGYYEITNEKHINIDTQEDWFNAISLLDQ